MYKNISMKIFITLLTLLLLTSGTSFAHCGGCATDMKRDHASEKHHHDDHASEKITATVVDTMPSLSLTEKTQKKFDKITEKYNEEKSELDADYKADIKKLLTDDEYAIFLQQIGDHSHKKSCCKTK